AGLGRGIDPERAREGMTRLYRYVTGTNEIPREGYFVELLRILLSYPEILAWEKLYMDARESMRKEIYGVVKAIDARVQVGWHLWHTIVYDPILRAETNYAAYVDYADYLKPAIYHACGCERMRRRCIDPHHKRLFRDVSPQLVSELYHAILGLDGPGYDKMNETKLAGAYVAKEIERIRAATGDQVPVYPGIDVDIPSGEPERRSEPEDLVDVLEASYKAGARGFVLSRKYSEMRLANLKAIGKHLKRGLTPPLPSRP
ncbi:MAG: hypothetical protein JW990_05600, partial [Thermoleophilia bacterium]|nr:hypothetical protein [Thermoleophilia bacterium]